MTEYGAAGKLGDLDVLAVSSGRRDLDRDRVQMVRRRPVAARSRQLAAGLSRPSTATSSTAISSARPGSHEEHHRGRQTAEAGRAQCSDSGPGRGHHPRAAELCSRTARRRRCPNPAHLGRSTSITKKLLLVGSVSGALPEARLRTPLRPGAFGAPRTGVRPFPSRTFARQAVHRPISRGR